MTTDYNTLLNAVNGLRFGSQCWCRTWVGGEHEPECAAMRDALTGIALAPTANVSRASNGHETIDQLSAALLDIARGHGEAEAKIIIADRLRKHITPYITAVVDAKEVIRTWHGMGMNRETERDAWAIYDQCAPEMKQINEVLS